MKTKIIFIVLIGLALLSSCESAPEIGLGEKSADKIQEELQIKELVPEPTEAVLPEDKFFREEFDSDINENWGMRVMSGLEKQLIWSQAKGRLRLQTLPPNDVNFVFLDKKNTFEDVIVQAEVENFGPLDNAFSLICRANPEG